MTGAALPTNAAGAACVTNDPLKVLSGYIDAE